jgi:hypothetical protein
MLQYGVAVLEKDRAIYCGLRLVLNHLSCSVPVNMTGVGCLLPSYAALSLLH